MNREPRYFSDASGENLVAIPLQYGNKEAILTAGSYQRLMEEGFGRRFNLNDNGKGRFYVRGTFDGRKRMVARYVVGAIKGQIVQYRDGDPLNLRPENLLIESGLGRSDCRFYENF